MRPAQKAPENPQYFGGRPRHGRGFNEAGAKSAGKLVKYYGEVNRTGGGGFNEAGAKSAGKPTIGRERKSKNARASMRPAQKAPENIGVGRNPELAYRQLQ